MLHFSALYVHFSNLLLKISDVRKKVKILKRLKAEKMKRNKKIWDITKSG